LYDSIVKQLQNVDLARNLGGYDARVIAPPGLGKKIRPNALVLGPGALFLGLLGGLGLAFLAELRDRRWHSAEEIRSVLGLPVLAHVSHAAPSGKSPALGVYQRPDAPEAEVYRHVRSALLFGLAGAGGKAVQVTSPAEGDGSTTLAANLAASLAQAGRRALLLDANLRRPRLHELFGLPAEPGLGAVLTGALEDSQALQPTCLPGLWVLPAGPTGPGSADLLTAPAFEQLLAGLRDQFEFVIVNTPPLLGCADAEAVAARVDAVLLNLRVGPDSRPAARAAAARLAELGARVLGVVVNGVGRRGRGGYRLEMSRPVPWAQAVPP
jgi:capsular exopolysaccharide synthesis family protein